MGIPVATYRLQLTRDFTLDQAAAVTGYLESLNISHIYLSPILESNPGSAHGYDVTDFAKISRERGGPDGFKNLCAAAGSLRILLDIVPNHMAATLDNPYWRDVLKNGPASPYRSLFDLKIHDGEKIRIPALSATPAELIEKGDLRLLPGEGIFCLGQIYPLNGGTAESSDIYAILGRQHYELVHWSEAQKNLSYRRFFNITGLIGVRVEEEDNYAKTHSFILDLVRQYPIIDGLRVDHIDGLADPARYLRHLAHDSGLKIWVEKILSRDEEIHASWPVQGTTGYEFIDHINQLFVHPENFEKIRRYWLDNIESAWPDFQSCVAASKTEVLRTLFVPELNRLVSLSDGNPGQAEIFWAGLTVALPFYRTYDTGESAIQNASARAAEIFGEPYTAAAKKLLPSVLDPDTSRKKQALREWRQLSGPVMAKGLEDTAHYRFTPLIALNDVGCAPEIGSKTPEDFFRWLQKRAASWPSAMNATSTHDTKRAEDVRHRLYALADMPDEWLSYYENVTQIAAPYKAVTPAVQYFLCQTILGTWPLDEVIDESYCNRLAAYMIKALRESHRETNWLDPDKNFESTATAFILRLLADPKFLTLTHSFASRLALCGALNSLSVQTLKILNPGVPDIYQGTESWDFSLVDPDNRHNVGYPEHRALTFRAQAIDHIKTRKALLRHLLDNWKTGGIKLWLTQALLQIRRDHFLPLWPLTVTATTVRGRHASNLIAWSLTGADSGRGLIVLCPRYPGMLLSPSAETPEVTDLQDATIDLSPAHKYHNLITDESVAAGAANLLADFPIAVLSFTPA